MQLVLDRVPAMEAPQSALAERFRTAFSLPVAAVLALALLTFLTCRSRFNDPDVWTHLKVGESIWNSHSLPRSDQYSYTTGNHAWIPHEWLSQVTLYSAYRLGGRTAVLLWLCLLASMLFALIYRLCCLYSGNPRIAVLGGIMGWFFGTVSLAPRPLFLGYSFLTAELLLVHLGRTRNRRYFWALPPLFAVWINCHGSYLLGLLVLGIFVFCSFVELRSGQLVSTRQNRRDQMLLGAVFVLCLAATFVNPVGPRLVAYPFDLFLNQGDALAHGSEWRPLDVDDVRGVGLWVVAGFIGLILLVRSPVLRLEELLLLLLGLGMALRHVRMLFIFGILAAPILCRLLASAGRGSRPFRDNRALNAVLIVGSMILMILVFPRPEQIEREVAAANPVGAVDFIRRTGLSGRMLNEYIWGGYLIWALPEHKVFVDTRGDLFAWTGVLRDYHRWSTLQDNPQDLLDKYGVQFCLLQRTNPLSFVMPHLPGWENVYQDSTSVVFVRTQTSELPVGRTGS